MSLAPDYFWEHYQVIALQLGLYLLERNPGSKKVDWGYSTKALGRQCGWCPSVALSTMKAHPSCNCTNIHTSPVAVEHHRPFLQLSYLVKWLHSCISAFREVGKLCQAGSKTQKDSKSNLKRALKHTLEISTLRNKMCVDLLSGINGYNLWVQRNASKFVDSLHLWDKQ